MTSGAPCRQCGLPITRGAAYCSRSCANRARMSGPGNPRWLGGVSRDNARYSRRFKKRFPDKARVHRAVAYAIKTGKLCRLPCACCERPPESPTHGHHFDYSRPRDVVWLCHPCHLILHRLLDLRKAIDSARDSGAGRSELSR